MILTSVSLNEEKMDKKQTKNPTGAQPAQPSFRLDHIESSCILADVVWAGVYYEGEVVFVASALLTDFTSSVLPVGLATAVCVLFVMNSRLNLWCSFSASI